MWIEFSSFLTTKKIICSEKIKSFSYLVYFLNGNNKVGVFQADRLGTRQSLVVLITRLHNNNIQIHTYIHTPV